MLDDFEPSGTTPSGYIETEAIEQQDVSQEPQETAQDVNTDPDNIEDEEADSVPSGRYKISEDVLPTERRDWMYDEAENASKKAGIVQGKFSKLIGFHADYSGDRENFLSDAEKFATEIGIPKSKIKHLKAWYKGFQESFDKQIQQVRDNSLRSRGKSGSINRAILILSELHSKAYKSKNHPGHRKSIENLNQLYQGKIPQK